MNPERENRTPTRQGSEHLPFCVTLEERVSIGHPFRTAEAYPMRATYSMIAMDSRYAVFVHRSARSNCLGLIT
jgi:hypothetical protein